MAQATTQSTDAPTERPSDALPDETLKSWLYDMQLIRDFEARTMQMYQQAKIGGFCHIYSGQEASAVGCTAAVNHDDPIILAYRDHGHALARGMHPAACMAEMFGKLAGCAKGKGGSMHMFDKPNWLYGGHGIVGAQTPVGAGLAFAARYQWEVLGAGKKKVCLCFLGDGALNQGAFHEAQNLAGLFNLPVIYIVENNGYSMGTAIERGTTMPDDLVLKASGYGIKGIRIEGLDIINVYNELKPIVDECRDLQRPAFVDLKTYRYQGHSMSDPQKYRTKEEVDEFKERDSIANLAAHLMSPKEDGGRGCLSEDELKELQKKTRQVVLEAVEFAEKAADPNPAKELTTDTYALPMKNLSPTDTYRHGAKNPLL